MKQNYLDSGSSLKDISHDQIAAKAYSLYVEGGRRDGHDKEHWQQAERLLLGQKQAPDKKAPPPLPRAADDSELVHQPDPRQHPLARDERGSAGRDEIRRENTPMRPAPRQTFRSQRRSRQAA